VSSKFIVDEGVAPDPDQHDSSCPEPAFISYSEVEHARQNSGQADQIDTNGYAIARHLSRMPQHHLHDGQPAPADQCKQRDEQQNPSHDPSSRSVSWQEAQRLTQIPYIGLKPAEARQHRFRVFCLRSPDSKEQIPILLRPI
jgi:hypothetical protein